MPPFFFASTPHIHFGAGRCKLLAELASQSGNCALLVTGAHSFDSSARCQQLLQSLQAVMKVQQVRVTGEPSPAVVDEAVAASRSHAPNVVIAVGGGSAVDAAKAIAGLLPSGDSVMDYLEGVGAGKAYSGISTPLIAIPTTAGTGGETSKNAVLSVIGEGGFKKSFRHEALVAKHVILDPELTLDCPPDVTAACGLDAFTQLLESFVSTGANPMTDALARSGMLCVKDSLVRAVEHGDDLGARSAMLYASSISGLTLANAGLGSVHGLASPLGAFFPIPHGVVCGTLLAEAVSTNLKALFERDPGHMAIQRYVEVARLMVGDDGSDSDVLERFIAMLKGWKKRMKIKGLSEFGVQPRDFDKLITHISGGSMSTNPIALTNQELRELLYNAL